MALQSQGFNLSTMPVYTPHNFTAPTIDLGPLRALAGAVAGSIAEAKANKIEGLTAELATGTLSEQSQKAFDKLKPTEQAKITTNATNLQRIQALEGLRLEEAQGQVADQNQRRTIDALAGVIGQIGLMEDGTPRALPMDITDAQLELLPQATMQARQNLARLTALESGAGMDAIKLGQVQQQAELQKALSEIQTGVKKLDDYADSPLFGTLASEVYYSDPRNRYKPIRIGGKMFVTDARDPKKLLPAATMSETERIISDLNLGPEEADLLLKKRLEQTIGGGYNEDEAWQKAIVRDAGKYKLDLNAFKDKSGNVDYSALNEELDNYMAYRASQRSGGSGMQTVSRRPDGTVVFDSGSAAVEITPWKKWSESQGYLNRKAAGVPPPVGAPPPGGAQGVGEPIKVTPFRRLELGPRK